MKVKKFYFSVSFALISPPGYYKFLRQREYHEEEKKEFFLCFLYYCCCIVVQNTTIQNVSTTELYIFLFSLNNNKTILMTLYIIRKLYILHF